MKISIYKNNPLLFKKTEQFDFENPQTNLKELCSNMIVCMKENKGIGLAANQIGIPLSVFVMLSDKETVFVNPEIIFQGQNKILMEEGCLSYPGLFIKIKRSDEIKLRYWDINGQENIQTFTGLSARVIQHEIEHLNGKEFFWSASRYHKSKIKKNPG